MIKYLIKAISSRSNIPTVYRAWYSSSSSSFKRSRCSMVCTHVHVWKFLQFLQTLEESQSANLCPSVALVSYLFTLRSVPSLLKFSYLTGPIILRIITSNTGCSQCRCVCTHLAENILKFSEHKVGIIHIFHYSPRDVVTFKAFCILAK